jgi:hypothetical protein
MRSSERWFRPAVAGPKAGVIYRDVRARAWQRACSRRRRVASAALVRLLEHHGLESCLREILAAVEVQKQERQQRARFELLEHLLEGQPPLTAEEIEAGEREWAELQSTPAQ